LDNPEFIVATDDGIFHKMQNSAPEKHLILAPTTGQGATCESCGHCPWMAMNSLQSLEATLLNKDNEIHLDLETCRKAYVPIQRMLEFAAQQAS
jgi:quinolinate synthase